MVNSRTDRLTTFSIEDLLQVFSLFYGGAEKRKMERFQSRINNKSSMHLCGTAEAAQFNPSVILKPAFVLIWMVLEYWKEKLADNLKEHFSEGHDLTRWCMQADSRTVLPQDNLFLLVFFWFFPCLLLFYAVVVFFPPISLRCIIRSFVVAYVLLLAK